MSYCRWSSDDYQCDIYAWDDVDGTVHIEVAGRRRVPDVPLPDPVEMAENAANFDEWWARQQKVREILEDDDLSHWMDLPNPGNDGSYRAHPAEAADILEELRAQGFNVPQYAIDLLREEADDRQGAA